MKLRFVDDAIFNGTKVYCVGQVAELDSETAYRWIRRGKAIEELAKQVLPEQDKANVKVPYTKKIKTSSKASDDIL